MPKTPPGMTQLVVILDTKTKARLKSIAALAGQTLQAYMTGLIRRAIRRNG